MYAQLNMTMEYEATCDYYADVHIDMDLIACIGH